MHFHQPQLHTRRAFLRRSGQLALTGAALPVALNLAAMGEAAAFNATDYKALVCVFLYGGNDYGNTVVPYDDTNYNLYSAIRGGGAGQTAGGIALAKAGLASTLLTPTTALANGRQYAIHPSMTGMAGLFNSGNAAVQLNVGPLIAPVSREQYDGNNRTLYPIPSKLFSHNDQASIWQSSSPEGSTVGWGGNIGDIALNAQANSNSLFTCISITGNTMFLSGDVALSYQVGSNGPVNIDCVTNNVYGSSAVKDALSKLVQVPSAHMLENEYNRVTQRQIASGASVQAVMNANPTNNAPFNTFPESNSLADQLKMVARLIAGRTSLQTTRQVFFVSLGGFDMHNGLLAGHTDQLKNVSDAMTAFYNATAALGVADKVTAFTASDFGRTLAFNGDGTDHGWGSHHFVVGGAVKGASFYGTPPPVSVGDTAAPEDQWHVGQGRLLPSTSVDQYAATLATWFGVEASELAGILPNLHNFGGSANGIAYPQNLGFMK